jgi:Carbohydrate family 9 binding domain-like
VRRSAHLALTAARSDVRAVQRSFTLALVMCALGLACVPPSGPQAWVSERGRGPLPADFRAGFVPHDALVGGRVRLIGARVDESAKPGGRVHGTLLWLVEKDCAGADPKVLVHVTAEGAELNLMQADHTPLDGVVSATEWRRGDVLADAFSFTVPKTIALDALLVRVGLYEGKQRWEVTPAGAHDGVDRVEVARVAVQDAPPLRARAEVFKRTEPVVIDGALDEPDWARAAALTLHAHDGKGAITRATTAKLLWDDAALYLAFEAQDPDPFTPYTKRDDPLYDSEAYEIFIDADGDQDEYVELQSAMNDVQFDAAFSGGRRKNMNKGWDADYQSKTRVEGERVTQEWRIPVGALRDVPAGEPKAGAQWRINLFRLERVRDSAKQKVTKHEASAWSPPLSGDFHNIQRMGTITFR